MKDNDEKKRAAHETEALARIIESLRDQAMQLATGRTPRAGFASDVRCVLDDAGQMLAAAMMLEAQAKRLDQLQIEAEQIRATMDSMRKEADKLRKQLFTPPAAQPAKPAAPAVATAKCKHPEWDTTKTPPVCKKCGATKSNRGRKSVSNPDANVQVATVEGVTKIDPPSEPLPGVAAPARAPAASKRVKVELGDGTVVEPADEDDEFSGGTVGSL